MCARSGDESEKKFYCGDIGRSLGQRRGVPLRLVSGKETRCNEGPDRITSTGKVTNAAVAPDGSFLTYAQKEGVGESLWKRQFSSGEATQLIPPAPAEFVGLAVTPAGDYAYFTTFANNAVDLSLWRISLSEVNGIAADSE